MQSYYACTSSAVCKTSTRSQLDVIDEDDLFLFFQIVSVSESGICKDR